MALISGHKWCNKLQKLCQNALHYPTICNWICNWLLIGLCFRLFFGGYKTSSCLPIGQGKVLTGLVPFFFLSLLFLTPEMTLWGKQSKHFTHVSCTTCQHLILKFLSNIYLSPNPSIFISWFPVALHIFDSFLHSVNNNSSFFQLLKGRCISER